MSSAVRPSSPAVNLAIEHGQRLAAFALLQRFADADDGRELGRDGGARLAVHPLVGVAEQPSPLGVADDDVRRAGVSNHRRADLAGEGALALEVQVLRGDLEPSVARDFRGRCERRERRSDDDFRVARGLDEDGELAHERDRFAHGLVHLPVRGEHWNAHALCPSRCLPSVPRRLAALLPPRNSSDAPPPVEMCVIESATPACVTAATESPPPMIVVPWTAATARATPIVPAANGGISNTPIGPFQTTVFARRMMSRVVRDRLRADVEAHAIADGMVRQRRVSARARSRRASVRRRDRRAARARRLSRFARSSRLRAVSTRSSSTSDVRPASPAP